MKKINLGGITKEPPAKQSKHATVKVGGRLEELIGQFILVNPQYKTFKGQHETLSRDIAGETRTLYWTTFAGVVPQSSTMLAQVNGTEVRLIVKDHYSESVTDPAVIEQAIGKENTEANFHWKTKYGLDFDQVPEDKQEALANGIEKLRAELDLPAGALSAKQFLVPNEGFHQRRTIILTPEQNQRLDQVLPVRSNPLL